MPLRPSVAARTPCPSTCQWPRITSVAVPAWQRAGPTVPPPEGCTTAPTGATAWRTAPTLGCPHIRVGGTAIFWGVGKQRQRKPQSVTLEVFSCIPSRRPLECGGTCFRTHPQPTPPWLSWSSSNRRSCCSSRPAATTCRDAGQEDATAGSPRTLASHLLITSSRRWHASRGFTETGLSSRWPPSTATARLWASLVPQRCSSRCSPSCGRTPLARTLWLSPRWLPSRSGRGRQSQQSTSPPARSPPLEWKTLPTRRHLCTQPWSWMVTSAKATLTYPPCAANGMTLRGLERPSSL
mmetsp:Transcript_21488/g.59698  ORF Transcript_21488/g.59698 Transcript_21488/m.59698 type:complete len:295 (+) Transcript_21488:242-1126(+)